MNKNFILIGDSIVDLDSVIAIQKRESETAGYYIKVIYTDSEMLAEVFDDVEKRDMEFNRLLSLLNVK